MNVAAPRSPLLRWTYRLFVAAFLAFMAAPLLATCLFAFNDSAVPSLPWRGVTLGWFTGAAEPRIGLFNDRRLMASLRVSFGNGLAVALLSTLVGTVTAFLFERRDFPGKAALYVLMVVPLVVPGIILGISILVFASSTARFIEDWTGLDAGWLRPGTPLVVLGQFSYLATITTLIVAARLRKFDVSLEEAALNLGAGPARVLATVTLPFLKPALLSSFLLAFLVSFQDFNTTLMLVGSESPLTVTMYDRMAKAGSTPVLNAMSVLLIAGSGLLALLSILAQRSRAA